MFKQDYINYEIVPLSERVKEFFKKEISISDEKSLKSAFMTLLDISFFEKDIDFVEFFDVKHYLSDILVRNAFAGNTKLKEETHIIDLYLSLLATPSKQETKEKADFLMFITGIFPKYIRKKGRSIDYYIEGISLLYSKLIHEGIVFEKLSFNTKPFVESLNIMSSKYLKIEKDPHERLLLH